jgi:signal transduction histidine kinase
VTRVPPWAYTKGHGGTGLGYPRTVSAWKRAQGLPLGAEVALAFAAGATAFVSVAVALAFADSAALAILLGAACVAAVVAVARLWGIAYAVPAAMAVLLAYDWFQFPPTHPRAFPHSGDLLDLLVYLGGGVLIGVLAAHAGRRADLSDAARDELLDEQSALRRVATLVARETTPEAVFAAVAEEVGRLLVVEDTTMFRYEDDGTATAVAHWSERDALVPVGARLTLHDENVTAMVRRTGRPARSDDLGETVSDGRIRCAVAGPIVVDSRLWGAMVAGSHAAEPLPADAEARIGEFTELAATAISNVQARSQLAASRARIVAAADDERRKVVRDLHDGAQQRLVHTVITLKLADRALRGDKAAAPQLVTEALEQAQRATDELRELAHGILPAVLTRGGLRAAVDALATRVPVPVEVDVSVGRLAATVEATAYFVVAEALTNVAKHAQARRAAVTAGVEDGMLRIDVRDDGVGGVRPDGSGLVGLADRLSVLDGRLEVESPAGGGTLVRAAIPVQGPDS